MMLTPVVLPPTPPSADSAPPCGGKPTEQDEATSFEQVLASVAKPSDSKKESAPQQKREPTDKDHQVSRGDTNTPCPILPVVVNLTETPVVPKDAPAQIKVESLPVPAAKLAAIANVPMSIEPVLAAPRPTPPVTAVKSRTESQPPATQQAVFGKQSALPQDSEPSATLKGHESSTLVQTPAQPFTPPTKPDVPPRVDPPQIARSGQIDLNIGSTDTFQVIEIEAAADVDRIRPKRETVEPSSDTRLRDVVPLDQPQAVEAPTTAKVEAPRPVTWSEAVHHVAAEGRVELQRSGKAEFEFRVSPPEMGLIRIKLSAASSGVTAELRVANASIQHLVETRLPELRERLVAAGVAVQGFSVSHDGGASRDPRQSRPASWAADFDDRDAPRPTERRASVARIGSVDVTA